MRFVKAVSSYFFCYCIEHLNQAGQITLFNEIHLPGQVYSLGQPPNIQRCPKSCSGEMIFSLIRQQFFFDYLPKHNTVRLLCSYNGIARLSLPLMLAWRQTLPKVLHRWNYIVLTFAAVSFDHHLKHAIYTSLFQPLSSHQRPQQPAPSKNALKRKSDNEVGTICETTNVCWLSCDVFHQNICIVINQIAQMRFYFDSDI